jgi:hypothetical protein
MNTVQKVIQKVINIIKMGLVKRDQKVSQPIQVTPQPKMDEVILTNQEVEFILSKMREATYKGHEFDMYARLYKKLVDQIKK